MNSSRIKNRLSAFSTWTRERERASFQKGKRGEREKNKTENVETPSPACDMANKRSWRSKR